ncbi:uncharacterized protein BKCO1_800081 [Diplodia corticola]|uniref:Uncharacterized protein n=1 Tax=Diplodia corticola TaxID=236234 RepID=A0A1J9R9H2_9PEZI|nr:uncharacterized protein BKCO1_800081 [Diplodia corticola]OJD37184.1 hypothetical protein BKCO1_800081 [Diplodia corticola]
MAQTKAQESEDSKPEGDHKRRPSPEQSPPEKRRRKTNDSDQGANGARKGMEEPNGAQRIGGGGEKAFVWREEVEDSQAGDLAEDPPATSSGSGPSKEMRIQDVRREISDKSGALAPVGLSDYLEGDLHIDQLQHSGVHATEVQEDEQTIGLSPPSTPPPFQWHGDSLMPGSPGTKSNKGRGQHLNIQLSDYYWRGGSGQPEQ